MSNNSNYNYNTIDNPYNTILERDSSSILSGDDSLDEEVLSGKSFGDSWINTWIKSTNYKPRVSGFLLDGQNGYIECMDLRVAGTTVMEGDVTIGDYAGGQGIFYDASSGEIHYGNITSTWGTLVDDGGKPDDYADVTQTELDLGADIDNAKANGYTLIDGGYINTGVLTADHIQTGTLNASLVNIEGEGEDKIKITGNDISLYDDSMGSGSSASLMFPRADDEDKYFIIKQRMGKNDDDESVMEMYYNEDANSGENNYIFLGIKGNEDSLSDWHTDAIRLGAKKVIMIGTGEMYVDFNEATSEIQVLTHDWLSGINDGSTRTIFSGIETRADAPIHNGTNYLDGGGLLLGLAMSGGVLPYLGIDTGGVCLYNQALYSITNGGSDLGKLNQGFGKLYIGEIHDKDDTEIEIHNGLIPVGDINIGSSGSKFRHAYFSGEVSSEGLEPASNQAYDIGSNYNRWDNLYVDRIYLGDSGEDNYLYEYSDDLKLYGYTNFELNGANIDTEGGGIDTEGGDIDLGHGTLKGVDTWRAFSDNSKYISWNDAFTQWETVGDFDVNGELSKTAGSFKIDHPLKPDTHYLKHSFVESPDMLNIYRGNAEIKDGECKIDLPDWFIPLNGDNKDDYSYQLTSIGQQNDLWVKEEIDDDGNVVFAGEKDGKFSYIITAIRHDEYAENHRIQVEVEKIII